MNTREVQEAVVLEATKPERTLDWRWTPGLRDARAAAGLTQQQLADKSGISKRAIVGLEARDHRARSLTLYRLADALGVGPEELTGGNEI